MNKRKVGRVQEEKAAAFLLENGYQIIEQNFYCHFGEIDIIAKDNQYMVFAEVKYRDSQRLGQPEEAVGNLKQRRIYLSAQYYIYKRKIDINTPCRFDVVALLGNDIRLYKNAFGSF